jgi:hypothetical protein
VWSNILLARADAVIIARKFSGPEWGIFDKNLQPILTGNAVVGVDYRNGFRVPDYPVEGGGFASFNKVKQPRDVRVSIAIDGSTALGQYLTGQQAFLGSATRQIVLQTIEEKLASLDTFNVVTPEFTYMSMNLVHVDYRRQSRGAVSMIVVDLWLQEVRLAPTPTYSNNTHDPAGADPVNGGAVQPSTATGTFPGPI